MSSDVALVGSWLVVLAYAVAQPLALMRSPGRVRAAALPLAVTVPVFALAAASYTVGRPLLPEAAAALVSAAALLYLLAVALGGGSWRDNPNGSWRPR